MSKALVQPLCTGESLVRSTYYSDTYRANFRVGDVQRDWDITHISLPFPQQKERELMARFGIPKESLADFYKDISQCIRNENAIVNFLAETSTSSVVKYVHLSVDRKDEGGSDIYIITEPFNAVAESDFFSNNAITLNNLLNFAARFIQIIKMLSEVGVHMGDLDLDTVFLSTTGNKQMVTIGSFLYGATDSNPKTSPKPQTLSAHAHPRVRDGENPTLETDIYTVTSLIWTLASGNHYSTAPDFSKPPKYASDEMIALLNSGLTMDASKLKAISNGFHMLMKKIKRGDLEDTIIRLAKPLYSLELIEPKEHSEEQPEETVVEPEMPTQEEPASPNVPSDQPMAGESEGADVVPVDEMGERDDEPAAESKTHPHPDVEPEPAAEESVEGDSTITEDNGPQEESSPAVVLKDESEELTQVDSPPTSESTLEVLEIVQIEDMVFADDLPHEPSLDMTSTEGEKSPKPTGTRFTKKVLDEAEWRKKKAESAVDSDDDLIRAAIAANEGDSEESKPKKQRGKALVTILIAVCLVSFLIFAGTKWVFPAVSSLMAAQPTEPPPVTSMEVETPQPSTPATAVDGPAVTDGEGDVGVTEPLSDLPNGDDEPVDPTEPPPEPTETPQPIATPNPPEPTTRPPVSSQPAPQPTNPQSTPRPTEPTPTAPPATTAPVVETPTPTTVPPPQPSASDVVPNNDVLTVDPSSVTMNVGDKVYLKPSISCQWSSSDPSIASFRGGYITGVSAGTCIITARAGTQTFQVTITVE